jgi:N-acetyl-D-muramate 6-phosphate phosphatase
MISAVLFDLDGTLADTAPDMARTVNTMRTERGLEPVLEAQVRPHVSKGARGMLQAAFGVKPEDPDYVGMRDEFMRIYEANLCIDSHLFPGMPELLDRLEAEGIRWGVVTNKYERFAKPLIECFGLADRAGVVVGGDTCARAKPFPDSLLRAADCLGVEPASTLYVGDDERDVMAARAAGMAVIVAGYGYLGDEKPVTEWGADAIIDSPLGINDWLRGRGQVSA